MQHTGVSLHPTRRDAEKNARRSFPRACRFSSIIATPLIFHPLIQRGRVTVCTHTLPPCTHTCTRHVHANTNTCIRTCVLSVPLFPALAPTQHILGRIVHNARAHGRECGRELRCTQILYVLTHTHNVTASGALWRWRRRRSCNQAERNIGGWTPIRPPAARAKATDGDSRR